MPPSPSYNSDGSFEYFSASSSPSYEAVSAVSSEDSEQIVWTLSSFSSDSPGPISQANISRSPTTFSDDDIVVISRARSPVNAGDQLAEALAPLAIASPSSTPSKKKGSKKKAKAEKVASSQDSGSSSPSSAKPKSKPKKSAVKSDSTSVSPNSPAASTKSPKKGKRRPRKAKPTAPVRPQSPSSSSSSASSDSHVVHELSDAEEERSMYENAVAYISSFLQHPSPKPNSDLPFLQALTIELGLSTDKLPATLTAARTLLKSKVFLNIRDYLDKRGQGLDALRAAMKPNRSALIREVKNGKRVPKKVVKESGLAVLLVTCH